MATQSLPRENTISELSQLLGDRLTTSVAVREQHGNGECGLYTPQPPDAVVFPCSTEEVSAIVSICAAHAMPMVPYGVGTSVEGNVTAPYGGVCIDLSQMKVTESLTFLPPGFRKEHVTPVDILLNKSGTLGFVALGRANHVGLFDTATREVLDYILVGKRAWGLALNSDETRLYVANGLSDDISIIDLERRRAIKSVKVGSVPYGILVFE